MINWVIGCILREENGPLFQVQRKAAAIDGSYQIRNSPIASDCIQLHGIKHLNIITGLALSICGSLSPVSTPWRWSLLHNDSAEWSQAPSDSHYSVKQHYIVRLTKYLPALCPRVPVCLLQHSILCFSGSWEQHRLTLSLRHLLASCIWPQDAAAEGRKLLEFPPPTSDEVATKNQSRLEFWLKYWDTDRKWQGRSAANLLGNGG